MFKMSADDRISSWATLRAQIEICEVPLQRTIDFWNDAPFVPYNRRVDPFNPRSWPTPWEIIVENQYDDFTKALMMGYSLKFTQRFSNSAIELRTYIDNAKNLNYNIICVDDLWAINYKDNEPVLLQNLPDSFLVENLIEVKAQR
jgi:hypothetical protein